MSKTETDKMSALHGTSILEVLESQALRCIYESALLQPAALLFSGGKDSATLLHLFVKAYHPRKVPLVLLHIDTGHNFDEVIRFRDAMAARYDIPLLVRSVESSMNKYQIHDDNEAMPNRNRLQSITLKDAIIELNLKAVFGGARRDEEKARAKERMFSLRSSTGDWDPRAQRPEPWDLLNPYLLSGHHLRIFPLSDWTERDIWNYIALEKIEIPSLYFAHQRETVVTTSGFRMARAPWMRLSAGDRLETLSVRCRTVGDISCTALMPSSATTIEAVISELNQTDLSERGLRMDDHFSPTAMEDRKREGYF